VGVGSDPSPFQEDAQQYDAWYETPKGRALLATEAACLRPLLSQFPRPYLEIGVGTGRFSQALEIEHGIDPSAPALEVARMRGVSVQQARGECIPFGDSSFGGVLMALTLCFVGDPDAVIREVRRVLMPGGGLVLGLLLKGTPWADSYARRGQEGHPIYSSAHFHTRTEVEDLLRRGGFTIARYRSTLFQEPGLKSYGVEVSIEGFAQEAGFVGLAVAKSALTNMA
jgi:ubiquinone/menaquinone biosynthesis C-methylase UbiE